MHSIGELTGTELDRAYECADYLLERPAIAERMDPALRTKLDTLRMDLRAEQEERAEIAKA